MRLAELTSTPNATRLLDHLRSPHADLLEVQQLDREADLESLITFSKDLMQDRPRGEWDAELAVALHRTLFGQPRRLTLSMPFWHWMTTVPLREFVIERWLESDPQAIEQLSLAEVRRFLGSATLNGVSRNALARLYWGAEALHDGSRGYELARAVLGNQDFYQQIFDRKLGLHPPVAKAMAVGLRDANEKERRDAAVRLNFLFSTIVAEQLDEEDVLALFRS